MKKLYTIICATKFVQLSLLSLLLLSFSPLKAQLYYYSDFSSPTGKYVAQQPSGGSACTSPGIANPGFVADADLSNYASISAPGFSSSTGCSVKGYKLKVKINMPEAGVPLGYAVGFKISLSSKFNLVVNGTDIRLNTYSKGVFSESNGTNEVIGLDVLKYTGEAYVSFVPTKAFDEVELVLNDAMMQFNINFEAKIYYAFTSALSAMPVTISNFRLALAGTQVGVSWLALTETNISHYDVERSSDGSKFSAVTSIAAKVNNGGSTTYSYTDNPPTNGTYFYRLKVVDKDGTTTYTGASTIVVSGKTATLIYPTIVKAGQPVNIQTSATGVLNVFVYDMQGRLVSQQRKAADGSAKVNTSNLSAGVYGLKIITSTGSVIQSKFVVNN